MSAELGRPRWLYPLQDISQNKAGRRTSTPPGAAAELVGVDGSVPGGLRPFPGFLLQHTLSGNLGGGEDTQELAGFFPITFAVSATKRASGYVYRVTAPDGTSKIFAEYIVDGDSAYRAKQTLGATRTDGLKQMDVVVYGRFVYVGVSGAEPLFFYLEPDGSHDIVVVTNTGPGPAPQLKTPTHNSVCVRERIDNPGDAHPDMAEVLTEMVVPEGEAGGNARILFFGFSNGMFVESGGVKFTNPYLFERNPSAIGGIYASPLRGPSDLKDENNVLIWASPPWEDPTFSEARIFFDGVYQAPQFPSPPSPNTEFEDVRYDRSAKQENEPIGLDIESRPEYVVAYQLYDSRTGRRSALSERKIESPGEAARGGLLVEPFSIPGAGFTTTSNAVSFPAMQVVYDSAKYDTLMLYRGTPKSGLDADQIILSLENTYTLEDWQIDTQHLEDPWRISMLFWEKRDSVLSLQPTYKGSGEFLEDLPTFGSGLFYETTFLFGNLGTLDEEVGGLGLIRWSDPLEPTVELVRPGARYQLQESGEEVLRFLRLGPNVLAMTDAGMYIVRRETNVIKVFPQHAKFGILNSRAATVVGSRVYFVSEKGLFSIDSDGSLTEVQSVGNIIRGEWVGNLDNVEMAYDPTHGVIIMHNPDLERTVLLWESTRRITEVWDTAFKHVSEGQEFYTPADVNTSKKRRALFVQEVNLNLGPIAGAVGEGYRWRVYTIDYGRQKGNTRLLDVEGTVITETVSVFTGASSIEVETLPGSQYHGCYLYVLDGDNAGAKAKISTVAAFGGKIILLETGTGEALVENGNLPIGTRLGISPIYMRWVGYQLGMRDQQGFDIGANQDAFRQRIIDSIGASFTNVSGDATDSDDKDARWRGGVYRGNGATALASGFPVDTNGAKVESLVDGPSLIRSNLGSPHGRAAANLFPFIEIFTPDVEYELIGALAYGKIDATDRESMKATGVQ